MINCNSHNHLANKSIQANKDKATSTTLLSKDAHLHPTLKKSRVTKLSCYGTLHIAEHTNVHRTPFLLLHSWPCCCRFLEDCVVCRNTPVVFKTLRDTQVCRLLQYACFKKSQSLKGFYSDASKPLLLRLQGGRCCCLCDFSPFWFFSP